ncbi:putative 30 kDa heat shock protein [Triangularia setosa]|uniref:30 kDa heat shock protein n=1 Tax=Triangularia setosa TaxID=2587417 RepID=A0AAN6W9U4_9PEZI|nr:putative 30 kDa heat shock protein [Podospora setosa]
MFSRSFYGADPSFTPLFRLLDDFDSYTREVQGNDNHQDGESRNSRRAIRTFTPKFDVSESAEAYELHGELPGITREDLSIEFSDPQTMVIKGKVERIHTAGTPPVGLLENNNGQAGNAITENGEEQHSSHKATVEDEKPEDKKATTAATTTTVARTGDNKEAAHKNKQPEAKFWLQERSIGEFSRTFSFPSRVEHEGVKAGLENGILTVVVPKAKKPQVHKVQIL